MPFADEVVERCADRQARDAEVGAELALGRDRLADGQPLDQVEHALARLALLRHRRRELRNRLLRAFGRRKQAVAGRRVEEVETRRIDRERQPAARPARCQRIDARGEERLALLEQQTGFNRGFERLRR